MEYTYKQIAREGAAALNCLGDYKDAALQRLKTLERGYLPYGSGFDSGCRIVKVDDHKIIIKSSYHSMNDAGYYDRWYDFTITAIPDFTQTGFSVKIAGAFGKHQDIRDYILDTFYDHLGALRMDVRGE
jgi:hypothetical protein